MAFKFQINEDVKFRHDAKMLEAATGYIPESRFETIHPVRLVELEADRRSSGRACQRVLGI